MVISVSDLVLDDLTREAADVRGLPSQILLGSAARAVGRGTDSPPPLGRGAERERQALRARRGLARVAGRGDRADLEVALAVGDALDALGQLDLDGPRAAGGDVVARAAELEHDLQPCELDAICR